MKETFKDIPKFEGLYQVSNLGRVKSLDREVLYPSGKTRTYKEKILKFSCDGKGRPRVTLSKESERQEYRIHELVMLAFVGERPENMDICHKDGDYTNNRLENLRYDTRSQNAIDFYRQDSKMGKGKLTVQQVVEIRNLYKTGNYSYKSLSTKFNISRGHVGNIINRIYFDYINDDGSIDESDTEIA